MSKPSDTGVPPLTIDQFIRLLGETPRNWAVSTNNLLRVDGDWIGRCPIEVVANKAMAFQRAGPSLGLCYADTQEIVHAADNTPSYNRDLRARLMEACGIGAGAQ